MPGHLMCMCRNHPKGETSVRKDINRGRISRRHILRGTGIAAFGLASAAILGCRGTGGQNSSAPATESKSGTGKSVLPLEAPVAQGKQRSGGVFTQATGFTYQQHDSHIAGATNVWHVIGERALEPDPITAKVLPHVVTSWEVADPTGLQLVLKVRPGIKMHGVAPWNGRDFTAADVAWNLTRLGGLTAQQEKIPLSNFQRASMVANMTKADAVDAQTVKVTLSRPNSAFFNGLTENRTPMMPKEILDVGFKDPMKWGGIGPFQISGWQDAVHMTYRRFDQYFRPNEPSFDSVVFQVIPDAAAQMAAFIGGQLQMISAPKQSDIQTIKRGRPDALLYTWIDSNWAQMRPSMNYGPFKDFRVRRAIFLATDRAAISDGYYGPGWAYQLILNPGFPEAWSPDKVRALPGYNPETRAKDQGEAAQLLSAAGFPNGKGMDFGLGFQGPSDNHKENAVRFQGQMLTQFPEMKVTLRPTSDNAAFTLVETTGKFDMVVRTITAVPDAVLEATSQVHTKGSRNYGHFSEPALDGILDKAIVELNQVARTALLEDFQTKFVSEWLPMNVLHTNPVRNMVQNNIGGYDKTAGTWYGYSSSSKLGRWFFVDK